jgi:hypothetical protein
MKTYGGVEVYFHQSLHWMEVSGQLHAPAALPPGKLPKYSLNRKLDGPQIRSGRCGEEEILAMAGIETGPSSP